MRRSSHIPASLPSLHAYSLALASTLPHAWLCVLLSVSSHDSEHPELLHCPSDCVFGLPNYSDTACLSSCNVTYRTMSPFRSNRYCSGIERSIGAKIQMFLKRNSRVYLMHGDRSASRLQAENQTPGPRVHLLLILYTKAQNPPTATSPAYHASVIR